MLLAGCCLDMIQEGGAEGPVLAATSCRLRQGKVGVKNALF